MSQPMGEYEKVSHPVGPFERLSIVESQDRIDDRAFQKFIARPWAS